MAAFETPWLITMSGAQGQAAAPVSASPTTALSASPTYATFVAPDTNHVHPNSPLLAQTPPSVTRALSLAYPYIAAADRAAALLTWTSGDVWASFLLVAAWAGIVLHWESIVRYGGHLAVVGAFAAYLHFRGRAGKDPDENPTLDGIIHTLNTLTTRLDMFVSPVTSISLTSRDLSRLLFTTLFLSPLYIIITFFLLSPRLIVLTAGTIVLTYHSLPARVTRTILWRSRLARLLVFYLTGIDFSRSKRPGMGSRAQSSASASSSKTAQQTQQAQARTDANGNEVDIAPMVAQSYSTSLAQDVADVLRHREQVKSGSAPGAGQSASEPVRFSYVVYENQRKWLGIGWTANLLAYERGTWTDEFLNDCPSADEFTLPDAEGSGMRWKWADAQWKIDKTNGDEEGWLYYDNTWKKPSKEDAFGKYTRRRRWVRTAELVEDDELTAAETEVTGLAPVTGDVEDYKPELERSESDGVVSDDEESAGGEDAAEKDTHQLASASTPVLPSEIDSAEGQGSHHHHNGLHLHHHRRQESNGSDTTKHDTWSELKKRTMLRHAATPSEVANDVE